MSIINYMVLKSGCLVGIDLGEGCFVKILPNRYIPYKLFASFGVSVLLSWGIRRQNSGYIESITWWLLSYTKWQDHQWYSKCKLKDMCNNLMNSIVENEWRPFITVMTGWQGADCFAGPPPGSVLISER